MPMPTPTRSATPLLSRLRRTFATVEVRDRTDGELLTLFLQAGEAAEESFAELVRRHGPMVLGVCRRVAGDFHAAEDAFQATFLVLARRAGSVRPRDRVGNFLYGIAYRTAWKVRGSRARIRAMETQVDPMPHPETATAPGTWSDIAPILDSELARLPDRLRFPVVLCDLEGRTHRDAARHLGIPPATLATRLTTARQTLARRLSARGVTLPAGALAALLTANAASATVPANLGESVLHAGMTAITGGGLAGTVPANVLRLSDEVIRMTLIAKAKPTLAILAVLLALGGGLGVGSLPSVRAADPAPVRSTAPAKSLTDEEFLVRSCIVLRGTPPSAWEKKCFLADADPGKRKKILGWLADGEPIAPKPPEDVTLQDVLVLPEGVPPGGADALENRLRFHVQLEPGSAPDVLFSNPTLLFESVQVEGKAAPVPPAVPTAARKFTIRLHEPLPNEEAFLEHIVRDLRGTSPTRIEREYFKADKDPKKQEKLIEMLLSDPVIRKHLAERDSAPRPPARPATPGTPLPTPTPGAKLEIRPLPETEIAGMILRLTAMEVQNAKATEKFEKLLGQLLEGKRSDTHVLDGLSAAILGRLPTESERKLILLQVSKSPDRKAAWLEVAGTLAGTEEARQRK